jgi:DNA-binding NtrC family response regulator
MARSSRWSFPTKGRSCEALSVLLIDGDDSFRRALAGSLSDDGHRVTDFAAPLALPLPARLASVQVVIADCQGTPGGLSFADELHGAHPLLPMILTTASWTYHLATEAARRDYLRLLRKPLDYDELHDLVHRLCTRFRG